VQLFRKIAEKRERDEREARMVVRRHGDESIAFLDDRIAKCDDGRTKAHWKRVQKLARGYVHSGIPELTSEQPA
jgi:hypothetical protein